jgi:hypothetical protein
MRLPRLQLTLRWMMVIVALVALAMGATLWGLKMRRLARFHALRASMSKLFETECRGYEADTVKTGRGVDELRRLRRDPASVFSDELDETEKELASKVWEDAAYWRRIAAHYASLKRKYERAARYPWVTIQPDPPEPE